MNREQQIQHAGSLLHKAVREGSIIKPTRCQKCRAATDSKHLHGHHFNYDQPLNVVWLCWKCHKQVHAILNWFRKCVGWLEFCKHERIDPAEGLLPTVNKKTGRLNKETYAEYWHRNSPRLRK